MRKMNRPLILCALALPMLALCGCGPKGETNGRDLYT